LFNLLDGPRRVSLLADCVHSDVSTVSRQVTMLVSHGLLQKVADTHDGRAFMVSLSAEGIDLVERLKVSRGEWFRKMLQDWEPGEAEAFGEYLERFAVAFEASKDEIRSITLAPTLAPTVSSVLAPVTTVIPPVTPSGQVLAGTANKEH
jgi:DNA-binding MarR family transcriptional regulator